MSEPTPESVDNDIDKFLNSFEKFDARIEKRKYNPTYIKTADRVALFAIYVTYME